MPPEGTTKARPLSVAPIRCAQIEGEPLSFGGGIRAYRRCPEEPYRGAY